MAILSQLLIAAGAVIGRGAHFQVEASRHHANEFCLLIGDSAKARKGSSFDHVARTLSAADPAFQDRLSTGLSSGEGLIWSVRDPHGADAGCSDPRLLITEPEFASVLKSTSREISTLSPVLRSASDARPLALLTRTAPARASAAHIAIIGHIAQAELAHNTNRIEIANGFLNRFILLACRRVRLLPEGGQADPLAHTGLTGALKAALGHARGAGQVRFDEDARMLWHDLYARLSEPEDGLHRCALRPLRATHDPSRADPRAARLRAPDQALPPARRTRALGLRRALRALGARAGQRRSARRADPRRAAPLPRRAHPHSAARPLRSQPLSRADRAGARRPRRHRQSHKHTHLHRRTAGRALERHERLRRACRPQDGQLARSATLRARISEAERASQGRPDRAERKRAAQRRPLRDRAAELPSDRHAPRRPPAPPHLWSFGRTSPLPSPPSASSPSPFSMSVNTRRRASARRSA